MQPENPAPPPEINVPPTSPNPSPYRHASKRTIIDWVIALVVICVFAVISLVWSLGRQKDNNHSSAAIGNSGSQSQASTTTKVTGLQLDPKKSYGNKYANGVLPVGDKKYQSSGPKQGYIYTCSQYAHNLSADQGGAGTRGPWFSSDGTTYNVNKKLHVSGSVSRQPAFTNTLESGSRIIFTNSLPNHVTGVFPIAASDPAYAYDRNPNSVKAQSMLYKLPDNPTYDVPSCMGGQAGIMLSGVALFNGFDAGGRDAGAWEIQDSCGGHPEKTGLYHYHTFSSCLQNVSVTQIVGYALDGFPITGPQVGSTNYLTTADLDECHGLTSQIVKDGKLVTSYHYVMTQDFPYSVSCFRGKAIQPPQLQSSSQQKLAPPLPGR